MDIQQNNGKQGVRTRHIDIRLTENEYEMIVEKAAECGLTLSNYGRKLLQNHHPNKRLSDEEVQGLNYMRAWIEAVNRLIVRWGQIRDSINQI